MPFYDAIRVGASGAAEDYEIGRSLRFQASNTDYLNRTSGTSTSQYKFTYSVWLKLGRAIEATTNYGELFNGYDGNNNNSGFGAIYFYNGQLRFAGWSGSHRATNRVFRDPAAWYHVVVAVDTTLGTADNRQKIYINGVEETDFSSSNNLSQNATFGIGNNSAVLQIGRDNSASSDRAFDGYMAEINYIDGQQLTPASFGQTKATTGQWVPKEYVGSYGNNGFYLNFSDNSGTSATTLGKDSSGNSNNFTPNNFSVSAGTGNSSVIDTPTNNFPVWHPLYVTGQTGGPTVYTYANLRLATNTGFPTAGQYYPFGFASFGATSGKWYAEIKNVNSGGAVGIANNGQLDSDVTNNPYGAFANTSFIYTNSGEIRTNNGNLSGQATYGAGDIIGIAMDLDNMKLYFHKNGTYINSGNPSTGSNGYTIGALPSNRSGEYIFSAGSNGASNGLFYINLGQIKTAGTSYADSEGIGSFDYAVPTGFKALCSKNLPDPTIKLPNKHFDTLLYSGTGSANSVTGLNFAPDWVWAKVRNNTGDHLLVDQVRGGSKSLSTNNSDAESSAANRDATFLSNGIRWNGNSLTCNESGKTYVAWNWDAGETDSATYRVVVVSDSGNKYRFRNSANTATFAQSAVTLDLAEGGTYTFDQSDSTMSSHPMKLSTTANGTHGGGSSYNTGVTYELDGSTVTESAFVSGFSSATSRKLIITVAASAPTLYYYCHYHSGMGGQANTNSTLGSSNFDGTIQTTVKANTTAGFSIVGYTGTNGTGTIGHGLGVVPKAVIVRRRPSTSNWAVYHASIGNTKRILIDSPGGETSASAAWWNNTSPTSTTVSLGNDGGHNGSTDTYIAYVFSDVTGYSKFGEYDGNGNSDGAFIHLGFRPAWFMLTRKDSGDNYIIKDSTRNTTNDVFLNIQPNQNYAENGSRGNVNTADFISNGFKIRGSDSGLNGSTGTYIYFAFAESPFKNSRAR